MFLVLLLDLFFFWITGFVLVLITWFVLVLKLGELENLEAVFPRGLLPPPEVHIWREPEIVTLTFGNRNCLSSSFRSTFVKHFESGETFYLHKQRQYIWIRLLITAVNEIISFSFQSNISFNIQYFFLENHFHFQIDLQNLALAPPL